jgi:DNA-binding NarL/FixJ family response regulator
VSISLLLADDHQMMRDGLRALLERQSDMQVVGEAPSGRSAVELARNLRPDVVVMDIGMRDLNGIDATREILAERPRTRVVALSMHSDKRYVISMLDAGSMAYVLKNCASDELVRAIRSVCANRRFFSAAIADTLTDLVAKPDAGDGSAYSLLTPRERQVLQLVAEGKTSAEIATELHVSVKTIETHRRSIMLALNLHGVADLTRYAIREGLVSAEQ